MVERCALLVAREELGRFSDLHDAEMTGLSLSMAAESLTLSFKAERFENDVVVDLQMVCGQIADLVIVAPRNVDPAFSGYDFPASALVDGVTINVADDAAAVAVQGTYGWSIRFQCREIVVDSEESNFEHDPV